MLKIFSEGLVGASSASIPFTSFVYAEVLQENQGIVISNDWLGSTQVLPPWARCKSIQGLGLEK